MNGQSASLIEDKEFNGLSFISILFEDFNFQVKMNFNKIQSFVSDKLWKKINKKKQTKTE